MRILHTYCMNYNIGDYALACGEKKLFRQYFDIDFIGETNIQGRVFNEYYIDEVVNKRYDLLVIGGGGIIHGAHWPNGWFWLIEEKLIRKIKIPFIVFAAGNNYFSNEGDIPQKAIRHLNETAKYAAFFSVRNDGSFERLIGQVDFCPFEQPDPGFHIEKTANPLIPCKEDYIIVQLAADKKEYRMGAKDTARSFVQQLRNALLRISKDFRIVFVPHVFDDVALSKEISVEIPHSICIDFGKYAFDKASKIVELYQNAKLVVAMRGHAQIIPIGFGIPVLSIFNHTKHADLLKKLDLDEYGIKIESVNFEKRLYEIYSNIISSYSNYKQKLSSIRSKLDSETEKAFVEIKNSLT